MAFVPVSNTLRVDLLGTIQGQRIMNSYAIKYPTSPDEAARTALADAMLDWWRDELQPILSWDYYLNEIDVTDLSTQDGAKTVLTVSTDNRGAVQATAVPNNTAIVASLRTNKRGRSYRGRSYIGGLPISSGNTEADINSTDVASLIAAFEALMTVINIGGKYWGVISRWLNKVQRGSGVVEPITAITMDTHWDSQRRRLAGRGRV